MDHRTVVFGTVFLLFGLQLQGQGLETRVLPVKNAGTAQDVNEVATVIRSIAEIGEISVNAGDRTMSVRATPEQTALATWLMEQLDRPAVTPETARHEMSTVYDFAVDRDGKTRVFRFAHADTIQHFQEMVTAIRSSTEIRRVFTYNAPRAVVMRGTAEQLAYAEWLFDVLDIAGAGMTGSSTKQFLVGGSSRDVARVYYAGYTGDVGSFQQLASTVRSIADIRSGFTVNSLRAAVLRAPSPQLEVAAWLLGVLDRPFASTKTAKHELVTEDGDAVRVFYLRESDWSKIRELMVNARAAAGRAFFYGPSRAVALRGTVAQMAQAESIIGDR